AKGWDARKRAYCLKIQPATGSFARNLIYSTKPSKVRKAVAIPTILLVVGVLTVTLNRYISN
ncbi:hypothetical protein, partial [Klebsiella pneumoniae]|uniref:hypothetical protein n=1 Tax=Klebsiella pneumoniae TaxID=573 RepID=UPI001D0E838A